MENKTLLNILLNGLEGEERDKALNDIKRAKGFLNRVSNAIDNELSKIANEQVSESDFDCPSWALKQSFRLGYKKGLTKLKEYAKIKVS